MLVFMIVALLGFIVDRVFFDDPKPAEAKATATPAKSKPSVPTKKKPTAAPTAAPVITDPSLAWLEKLADPRPGRDVFVPSPAWLKAQKAKEEVAKEKQQAEAQGPKPGSPEAFQTAHRLQATTVMEHGGLAVVDGECLSVGDAIDDFQLVRVTAGEAEFRRGRNRAILKLPMGPASSAKPSPAAPTARKNATPTAKPAT
jgi:hypothetical protein